MNVIVSVVRVVKSGILLALLIAACTSAPKAVPASALEDHSGDSMETAIAVPADAPNGGVDFENRWLFDRYGKFRRYFGGTGTASGRRYDVVKIELPGGEKKTVYFDITENWAAGTS